MPGSDITQYIFENVKTVYLDESIDFRRKFYKLYSLFQELINQITAPENQFFNSDYSKIEFIINKYFLNEEIGNSLRSIRRYASKLRKNLKLKISQNEINFAAKITIILAVKLSSKSDNRNISEEETDPFIQTLINLKTKKIPFQKDTLKGDFVNLLDVCVMNKYFKPIDEFRNEYFLSLRYEDEHYEVQLSQNWEYIYSYADINSCLNFINISIDIDTYKIRLNRKSMIILEPNFLFDVTEIAECFSEKNYDPLIYFLNILLPNKLSYSMLKGNLVNNIFDELILNPEISFEECYENGIKTKPLSLYTLSIEDGMQVRMLESEIRNFYENIQRFVKNIDNQIAIIEPSFISAQWGMQGRLDLLLESGENEHQKDIVELKSGNFPEKTKGFTQGRDGNKIATGMWNNHYAQVSCYNMILSSADEKRIGNSSLFYAKSSVEPNRNAPISEYFNLHIVNLRNELIHNLVLFSQDSHKIIDKILKGIDSLPIYKQREVNDFVNLLGKSSELEQKYYFKFVEFVIREFLANSINSENKSGISDLWKKSIEEKEDKHALITKLELMQDNSDFENLHLYFKRNDGATEINAFRKGDIVILYQITDEFISPINDVILKCTIKEIDNSHILLSLRNKLYPKHKFTKDMSLWVIEQDLSDSNTKKQIGNMYEFLSADSTKKSILLGKQEPRINEKKISVSYPEMTDNQNNVLCNILNSKDYYLLQGPPGTGKTSYVIRFLVKYLMDHTQENILLIAYTNRAVDEICEVLNKLRLDYLRLGSRESSVHQEKLLCNMVDNGGIRQVFKEVRNYRIVVSTVFSAVNNNEIFRMWHFNTVVADEASQVLEPQIIGILSKTDRFVLIGDEKQLPAISIQEESKNIVEDEELINIGMCNFSNSIFERLLRNATNKKWKNCVGTLYKQARMHKSIQEFPNKYFYNSALEILNINNKQSRELDLFKPEFQSPLIEKISRHRYVFLDFIPEPCNKYNLAEATITADIIKNYIFALGDSFTSGSIGVISPFRAQCAAIKKILEAEISAEYQDMITIDTVERFQGSEREIIIYSFATNYFEMLNRISSLTELFGQQIDRKLNVALTRAKEQVIILGSSSILSQNIIYNNLIEHCRAEGSYFKV